MIYLHCFFFVYQGYILTSEIDGTIQMKSYLSGNPEIRLALNEDLRIGGRGGLFHGTFVTCKITIQLWNVVGHFRCFKVANGLS